MKEPKIVFNKNVYQLKVTFLNGNKNQPYRVIEIVKSSNLTDLFEYVIISYDLYFGHCFGFYNNIRNWVKSSLKYEQFADDKDLKFSASEGAKSPNKTTIEKMFKEANKMLLLYDYGTEREFVVEFIQEDELLPKTEYPRTIKQRGKISKKHRD